MNLYEALGLVAVFGGVGASYGATQHHDTTFWASLVIGLVVGFCAFVALHRLTAKTSERALLAHYIGMPICVLVATIGASWLVRASF